MALHTANSSPRSSHWMPWRNIAVLMAGRIIAKTTALPKNTATARNTLGQYKAQRQQDNQLHTAGAQEPFGHTLWANCEARVYQ